MGMKNPP
ncbi:Protein of unknown function [Bacillus mycoides]|nr:Protein of unknown function [Bacillus mycoides]SCC22740.1 Protein of unknown function [Bacillus mycoides]SCM86821.1 Protein of unknown function [Bacillus mycoides]